MKVASALGISDLMRWLLGNNKHWKGTIVLECKRITSNTWGSCQEIWRSCSLCIVFYLYCVMEMLWIQKYVSNFPFLQNARKTFCVEQDKSTTIRSIHKLRHIWKHPERKVIFGEYLNISCSIWGQLSLLTKNFHHFSSIWC